MDNYRNDAYELLKTVEKNTIMIGKFDASKGIFPLKGAEHVLMFDISPLCDEPSIIKKEKDLFKPIYINENKYSGFVRDQNSDVGLPPFFNKKDPNYEDQKEQLIDFYSDQFIFFSPSYQYERNEGDYHKNLKILDVVNIPVALSLDTQFKIIPKVNLEKRIFEKKIANGDFFVLDYAGDIYNDLDYIMCDSYLYYCDSWKYNQKDPLSWQCSNPQDACVERIKVEKKDKLITCSRTGLSLVFIDESYMQEVRETGEQLSFGINKNINADLLEQEDSEEVIDVKNNDEFEMLESFKQNVINSSLCYDFEDLINLHICAKSSPLTILAGMSGTGKTQLALQYAKMIDTQEINNTLLFLPITPSYTEPDDILGYLNPNNGLYIPAETGLVDFLINAQANPDKMHMVLFDEMNLSQIEYWFSPFISVLEKDLNSRYLTLYNEKSHCINRSTYPHQIKINNNVIFIGTINLDETTKDISDRLLDRAFVINLKKKKFTDFYSQNLSKNNGSLEICDSAVLFNQWRSDNEPITAFVSRELDFLDELHEIISKYDEQKGVSFRVLKNIGTYINNIPTNDSSERMIEKKKAFDLVLKQTVMKKLSGPDNRLNDLVGVIDKIGDEPQNSKIIDLFEKYSDISDFKDCRESLKRKAEDLLTYGYTR